MSSLRLMVSAADAEQRRAAVKALTAGLGCDVFGAEVPHCVDAARCTAPDLLVLFAPGAWTAAVGVLAALSADPRTRHVPVLVFDPAVHGGPFPRVPRLFLNGPAAAALPHLLERTCSALRACAPAP